VENIREFENKHVKQQQENDQKRYFVLKIGKQYWYTCKEKYHLI
jgi:hypothetical protein